MKKLIAVTVKFGFVVAVDADCQFVENACRTHIQEATRDMSMDQFDVATSDYAPGVVAEWDGFCLPYGGDGNKMTNDYLREAA